MSFFGHSKIVELLTGIKDYELQNNISLLSKYRFSELRHKSLRKLAELERSTIPSILKNLKENKSGGTYLTINRFFQDLQKEGILNTDTVGKRTYWKFSVNGQSFRKFLLMH